MMFKKALLISTFTVFVSVSANPVAQATDPALPTIPKIPGLGEPCMCLNVSFATLNGY